jgi:2-isopropylmalate synthase
MSLRTSTVGSHVPGMSSDSACRVYRRAGNSLLRIYTERRSRQRTIHYVLACHPSNEILGTIRIRHELDVFFREEGGDIGYDVAPSFRNNCRDIERIAKTFDGVFPGNTALDEVVMALRTREDYFAARTEIKTDELYKTSRMVADALGISVPPNKAIIGANAFSHGSGIHVGGFLKERQTFEIIDSKDVGAPESSVILTARTGRHGVNHRLEELGYHYEEDELERIYSRLLKVADKKQEVYDEDLVAIVHDEVHSVPACYVLEYLHTTSGTGTIPTSTVRLKIGDVTKQGSEYVIRGVKGGTEAMGEVVGHLEQNGKTGIGRGVSTDIIEASARALVDGLNRLASTSSTKPDLGESLRQIC